MSTLGAILIDGAAIEDVASNLRPDDFFDERNQWVYAVCLSLYERGEFIDQISISEELARQNHLEDIGGISYLSQIVTTGITYRFLIEHHAGIVRNHAVQRRLITALGKAVGKVYEGKGIKEIINDVFSDLEASTARVEGVAKQLRILGIKKITSRPPKYDVILNNASLNRLSWETLLSYGKFRSHIGETLDFVPAPIKQSDWEFRLNHYLDEVDKIEAPKEASEEELIKLTIAEHIMDSPLAETVNDLVGGLPYRKDGFYHFQSKPLRMRILQDKHKISIKPNELWALLKEWGAKDRVIRIGSKTARVWALPINLIEESVIEDKTSEPTEDFPQD